MNGLELETLEQLAKTSIARQKLEAIIKRMNKKKTHGKTVSLKKIA